MTRVIASKYRGQDGWSITGTDTKARHIRIFCNTYQEARRMCDDINHGKEPVFDMFLEKT